MVRVVSSVSAANVGSAGAVKKVIVGSCPVLSVSVVRLALSM